MSSKDINLNMTSTIEYMENTPKNNQTKLTSQQKVNKRRRQRQRTMEMVPTESINSSVNAYELATQNIEQQDEFESSLHERDQNTSLAGLFIRSIGKAFSATPPGKLYTASRTFINNREQRNRAAKKTS
jgi:hypothetical protein